jgi:hypothetical protein
MNAFIIAIFIVIFIIFLGVLWRYSPLYEESFHISSDEMILSDSADENDHIIDMDNSIGQIDGGECSDLEAEFTTSREFMGASTGKQLSSNRANLFTRSEDLAVDDEQFDRAVTLGRKSQKPSDISAVKLLYTDVMNLNVDDVNYDDICEYTNEIGYLYKEGICIKNHVNIVSKKLNILFNCMRMLYENCTRCNCIVELVNYCYTRVWIQDKLTFCIVGRCKLCSDLIVHIPIIQHVPHGANMFDIFNLY